MNHMIVSININFVYCRDTKCEIIEVNINQTKIIGQIKPINDKFVVLSIQPVPRIKEDLILQDPQTGYWFQRQVIFDSLLDAFNFIYKNTPINSKHEYIESETVFD